ncbi:hypothetical protein K435DRAFT_852161 [Dendrothele bispora CBS 962.96]|uniref:Uncharacterized protein n=1 Tax=Dendrothele bispora (strain CBS 962.96) TaxID=1314807 RepID=A0A4S8MJV2_DENBC|nr:hypothetical protein K435DRAFT_852161 [Dendrothele bispora CBS 962.96]
MPTSTHFELYLNLQSRKESSLLSKLPSLLRTWYGNQINAVDSLLCLQQDRSWKHQVDPQPTREESSRTYVPGSTHRYLEFKTFRDHSNSIHVDFGGESTTIQMQMLGKVVKPRPRDPDGTSETAGVKLGLRVDFVAKNQETAAKLREFLITRGGKLIELEPETFLWWAMELPRPDSDSEFRFTILDFFWDQHGRNIHQKLEIAKEVRGFTKEWLKEAVTLTNFEVIRAKIGESGVNTKL